MSFIESGDTALLPMPESLLPGLAGNVEASLALPDGTSVPAATAAATSPTASAPAVPTSPQAAPQTRTVAEPAPSVPAQTATTASVAAVQRDTTAFPARPTATVAQVGKPAAMPHAPSAAGSIGSAIFALAMVIGLILALAWLARRMPGLRGTAAGSSLRVVGSLALSPRERLVVVAIGDTQLALAVGTGGTRTLHTLSEPLPVAASAGPSAFAQVLSQHFGKKA